MSVSSEDSLSELPRPYDISSAVSRALRINSENDETCLQSQCISRSARSLTAFDDSRGASIEGYEHNNYYPAECRVYDLPTAYGSLTYPIPSAPDQLPVQRSMEFYSDITTVRNTCSTDDLQANPSHFFKYVECADDERLPAQPPEFGPLHHFYDRRYTISGDLVSPTVSLPMRKKIRSCNSVTYMDDINSPEISPVKKYPPPVSCYPPGADHALPWKARLENSHLWRQFDEIGTEMVITKGGRRMFPSLVNSFSGLDPHAIYTLRLEILSTDGKRYKFLQTEWVPVGKADKKQVYRDCIHPDSPNTGAFWMDKEINFKLVKLTNNKTTKYADQMILNSMQKYQPRLQLICETTGATKYFQFPETKFIAVTAYQNSEITQLKINNNPYARAFRESMSADGSQKGGHLRLRQRSVSPNSASPQNSPVSTPSKKSLKTDRQSGPSKCVSAVSVESGFESGDSNEQMQPHYTLHTEVDSTMLFPAKILAQPNPFSSSSLTYWADDNSLWNPNLITPDPLMDSTSSFSEPYLRQSSSVMSYTDDVSPIKGFSTVDSSHDMLQSTVLVEIETIDDDVFF